jgi:hypothetical protein
MSVSLVDRTLSLAIACLIGSAAVAVGGPIRHSTRAEVKVSSSEVRAYWDNYYAQALRQHRMQVKGLNALKVLRINPDGTLPQIPMVAYLQWRWSLNPTRFAQYHPLLSRWIVRDRIIRSIPENPTGGGVKPPPAVPEPSSLLVAALFTGVIAAARIGRRRNRPNR